MNRPIEQGSLSAGERGAFLLLMLAIFSTEVVLEGLFAPLFAHQEHHLWSVLNALLLSSVLLLPLWFFFVRPLYQGGCVERRGRPWLLLVKAQAIVFAAELAVMLSLRVLLPGLSPALHQEVDAICTTLLSAPFLWRTFFPAGGRPPQGRRQFLDTPLRLYIVLLLMVFLFTLLQEFLCDGLFTGLPQHFSQLVESLFVTACFAPLLWFLMARPLTAFALSERARLDALYAQVTDPVLTLDEAGVVQSVNPAACRVLGYAPGELTGRDAELLFPDGGHCIGALLERACREVGGEPLSHELWAARRDGSLLTVDTSVSRVQVRGCREFLLIMRDITEKRLAQKELSESHSLLSATLEATADAILAADLEGRVRTCNAKLLEMWGISREVALKGTRGEMLEAMARQLAEPEVVLARVEELERTPLATTRETVRFLDGRVCECHCHPQLLGGTVVGRVYSFRDVTERERSARALKESEARFREIFNQSEDAILFFQPGTCTILDANCTAETLYGFSRQELKELGVEPVVRPEDLLPLSGLISGTSRGRISQLDRTVHRNKDGGEFFVSVRCKLMTLSEGEIVYCTVRNITERIRLEEEAREMQSKLIQVNKMTSLGLLVSGVAHEVNNPNNFILANSQLLARAWEDALKILAEYREENGDFMIGGLPFSELRQATPALFSGILDGSRRINEIINNLKAFARQDRVLPQAQVDLNQVVQAAVSILHYELVKYTEKFHLELSDDLPRVTGSGQQLGQVTINLLMNACQALPSRARGIWLSTRFDREAGEVTVSVRDEGCGMTKDESQRVLEPFFTTKLDSGGTGLGLSICHSIVKEHGGVLEFTSQPGLGSTFTVRLPVRIAESEVAA